MKKNKNPIFGLSMAFLFLGPLTAGNPPSNPEVTRELQRILSEPPFNNSSDTWALDNKALSDFLTFLATNLYYPLIITIVIAALFGLYFLIRRISPYIQTDALSNQAIKKNPRNAAHSADPVMVFYRQALSLSQAGEYRLALLALHKATIEFLLRKIVIAAPQKHYSNNDFRKMLRNYKKLDQPFRLIAKYAEIAGFSIMAINQADFAQSLQAFEENFLTHS
jgi:hypothetical protein